jgi:pSer/pThr/pTyr-binding forkhead associated (FHA) protein
MHDIKDGQKTDLTVGAKIQLLKGRHEIELKAINRDDPSAPSITFELTATGERFSFTGVGPHTIGRSRASGYRVKDELVSRTHASIEFAGEAVTYSHFSENKGRSSNPVRDVVAAVPEVEPKPEVITPPPSPDKMNKIKKGELTFLQVGIKVQLLEKEHEMEVVAVGRDETQQPFVTFRMAGTKEEFTFTGRGPHTIGREWDCTRVVGDEAISRKHAKVHFSGDVPVYSHYAMNRGYTTGVVHKIEDRVQDAGETVNRAANNANVDIKLKHGMQIQFHPHLPVYEVTELTVDPKRVKLGQVVERGDRAHKDYPLSMEATGEIPASLGTGLNYNFYHAEMPSEYALLGWDHNDMTFQLSVTRGPMPTVLPGKDFLVEQENILAKLQVTDRDAAEKEIANIKRLLGNIDKYQAQMDKVQDFEGSIVDAKPHHAGGARTEESQIGYVVWLQSLAAIYKDSLNEKQQADIDKMSGVLKIIAADRTEVRDIENYDIPPYKRSERDATPYTKSMRKYVGAKSAELKQNGETYLVAGFQGHHVVARLQGDAQKGYVATIYNAGAEAIPAPKGPSNPKGELVMGTYEHRLKPGVKPEEFIRSLTEKKSARGMMKVT